LKLSFGHVESELLLHLTESESQADMMVGVLKGVDIGLFVSLARLMLWLTQLAGRPIAIIS
jgi:hypothetical protein